MNVKNILELDRKRTQGEWFSKAFNGYCDIVESSDGSRITHPHPNYDKEYGDDNPDAQFIAAAPRMVEIIKEQQAKIDKAVEVLLDFEIVFGLSNDFREMEKAQQARAELKPMVGEDDE